jgi:DnaJ-class molecular chaperone
MAKSIKTVKKVVKKAVKKEVKKEVKKKEVKKCEACSGTGLIDPHNICVMCDGSGKVS